MQASRLASREPRAAEVPRTVRQVGQFIDRYLLPKEYNFERAVNLFFFKYCYCVTESLFIRRNVER